MSKAVRECWNCQFYSAYYTKGFCQFDKQKIGYCGRKRMIVENIHSSCENWYTNYRTLNSRKKAARKKLDDVVDCIFQIKQILFEEQEEIKPNE